MPEDDIIANLPKERSPAFPYIALELALNRAKKIYSEVRDHAQPREVLAKAYGKPATSSATIQTFATLLQYGLLENVAGPQGRRMRISALAQTILQPHAPPEKARQAIQKAALNPPVFDELWTQYGDTNGLNESVPLYYLTVERGHDAGRSTFTDKAARDVLRIYRDTLSFAGVSGRANNQQQPEHEGTALEPDFASKVLVRRDQPMRDTPVDLDDEVDEGWSEERLIDDGGDEIKIRYRGKATAARYEFIRDYLDFKIKRLEKKIS